MPPECSHNKQGRRSGCDIESSARLSMSRFPPVCNKRARPSPNLGSPCSITASGVCWPACPEWQLWFICSRSFGSDWCWKTDTLFTSPLVRRQPRRYQPPRMSSPVPPSALASVAAFCCREQVLRLLSWLLEFYCSRRLFFFFFFISGSLKSRAEHLSLSATAKYNHANTCTSHTEII